MPGVSVKDASGTEWVDWAGFQQVKEERNEHIIIVSVGFFYLDGF